MQYYDILFFVYSFFLAFSLTPLIMRVARRFNIMDIPFGSLKVHKIPTPYLGGVLIYLSFFAIFFLFLYQGNIEHPFSFYAAILFFIGLTGFLLVGLYDDIYMITPIQKLVGQILSTLILLSAIFLIKPYFFMNGINFGVAFFVILSLVNAFNLVDVMDGLSTTLALSSSSLFFVVAFLQDSYEVALALLIFSGALVGFLCWNKPSAKIYLGDAGALFLGAFVSVVPFFLSWSQHSSLGYFVPLTFMSVPLLEVFFLIIIRLMLSIRPWNGSPHHFSILLQKKGWTKMQVLCWGFCMNTLFALIGIGFMLGYYSFILFLFALFLSALFWIYVVFDRGLFFITLLNERSLAQKLSR